MILDIVVAVTWGLLVAGIGAGLTDLTPWYRSLRKPSWQPPDWLFGPAWTVILALASWSLYLALSTGRQTALVVALFVVNGVLNHAGLKAIREGFARWGYPRWFHLVNAIVCIAIGVTIAWYPTRPFGLLLSLIFCLAVWATLLRHRDFRHLPPSVLLAGVTVLAAWGLRLI